MTTTIEKLNKIFHEAVATPSIVTNTGEYRIDEKILWIISSTIQES